MKITNTGDWHLIVSKVKLDNNRIPVVVPPGSTLDVEIHRHGPVTVCVANRAATPEEREESAAEEVGVKTASEAIRLIATLDPKQRDRVKKALQD